MCAVKPATCVSELAEFYRESCRRHNAQPIESIMKHLDTLDLNSNSRRPVLNLREQNLTAESCEALEEVLKRVSHMHFIYEIIYSFVGRNSREKKNKQRNNKHTSTVKKRKHTNTQIYMHTHTHTQFRIK